MDAEWTPVPRPAPVTYASRLAELEQMLQILERARVIAEADSRPKRFEGDPVALTQALHPEGRRSARRSVSRLSPRENTDMPVRVVVFDGTSRD